MSAPAGTAHFVLFIPSVRHDFKVPASKGRKATNDQVDDALCQICFPVMPPGPDTSGPTAAPLRLPDIDPSDCR